MALETITKSWEDYESVQVAFRRLKRQSKTKSLARGTYSMYKIWMPRFIDFTRMNPDELIAEGMDNSDRSEDRLSDFYSAISTKQLTYARKVSNNSLRTCIFGHLRGFFTKNGVNTARWTTPILEIAEVDQTDSRYPLFVKSKLTGKLDLNRDLLTKFFRNLNERDEVIALCLMSCGLDSSDILDLTIADIEMQDEQERIFVTTNRRKTSEMAKSFLSREATQKIRQYIRNHRKEADRGSPVFTISITAQKQNFKDIHGRQATINDELEALPLGVGDVAKNFRLVQEKIDIITEMGKQSPLRPKRLRKVFKTASTRAGLDVDTIRVFMGQSGQASKVYLGKSREELESYYEMVEPFLTLYKNDQHEQEMNRLEKQNQELIKRIEALEEQQFQQKFERI